jgi:hypothetical protein
MAGVFVHPTWWDFDTQLGLANGARKQLVLAAVVAEE